MEKVRLVMWEVFVERGPSGRMPWRDYFRWVVLFCMWGVPVALAVQVLLFGRPVTSSEPLPLWGMLPFGVACWFLASLTDWLAPVALRRFSRTRAGRWLTEEK